MTKLLYLFGVIEFVFGGVLIGPTLVLAARAGDPLAVLGAPIVMSGVSSVATGMLLVGLGSVLAVFQKAIVLVKQDRESQKAMFAYIARLADGIQNSGSESKK